MRSDLRLRSPFHLLAFGAALALAACGSSSTAATSPSPSTPASPSAPATPSATTTLDPCQLVTSQEASALTGVTFGPGTPEDYTGSKGCGYGSGTLNIFRVVVAQAPDAATAQADWAQEQAQAQTALAQAAGVGSNVSLTVNDVSNVAGADRAAVGSGSFPIGGKTFNVSAIYVIKGAVFFSFSDIAVDVAAPTAAAMEAQAQTVIGRLP
ncbi:MAG TPA: DUF3558 family protein [Patescibacteria group bacterium]|nr:DUF3558 family protein [Patescibacteria group bacterium]